MKCEKVILNEMCTMQNKQIYSRRENMQKMFGRTKKKVQNSFRCRSFRFLRCASFDKRLRECSLIHSGGLKNYFLAFSIKPPFKIIGGKQNEE